MSQIIISDLESNLELDRKALSDVLGGKNRNGGYKNRGYRRIKFSYEEKYQYKDFYKGGHYGHYDPCHFNHHHCCSW